MGMPSAETSVRRLLRTRAYRQLSGPQGFDLFHLLDEAIVENSWSALLAFLCDSSGSHGLGLSFVEEWQAAISRELSLTGGLPSFRIPRGVIASRGRFQWPTPGGRLIDVVVELLGTDGRPRYVLGVENKRGAAEQANQIRDYQAALHDKYPYAFKVVLFLTPDGTAPSTASRGADCPCYPISYRTVTEACIAVKRRAVGDVRVLMSSMARHLWARPLEDGEMREDVRLRKLVEALHKDPKHRLAVRTLCEYTPSIRKWMWHFKDRVRTACTEMNGKGPKGRIYFETYPRSAMNPRELKVYAEEMDNKSKGFYICYMLHADDMNPTIGSEYRLRVMAWCESAAARRRASSLRGILKDRGRIRGWNAWEPLWVGDSYRLRDLGKRDATMLADLVSKSLRESYSRLLRALQ